MNDIRIYLNEDDFARLVAGSVIQKSHASGVAHIMLHDIGYNTMDNILQEAKSDFYKKDDDNISL
jgi:hypothetical protein